MNTTTTFTAPKIPVPQLNLEALSKSFEPATLENHWTQIWDTNGYASAGYRGTQETKADAPSFCIQLPPPNVTGTLHMGHAFNQTIMDALARYHRMSGFNAVWVPGTDHAGIATQVVVERQLQAQNISRHTMGATVPEARKNFVAKVWEWKEQSGNTITQQMRRMGASVDWSREYFTMDDNLSKTVTETFVRLFEQGLIYRGKRLVNWDPVLKSAVSDVEVENEERNSFMWHIEYPFVDGVQTLGGVDAGKITTGLCVATTRPETMLGDGALCVHPDDERYRHLVGKHVHLPLCGRSIPIVADDFVDPSFGSGCVKITGAHDFNDYACSLRNGLPLLTIFTLDAKINENAPAAYQGMDRYVCRKTLLKDLEDHGFLKQTVPHKNTVPVCTRTGQVIEPMLTSQWFVAMNQVGKGDVTGKSIAQKAIDAVENGEVQFHPEQWVNTYNSWMNGIQDWCISRQLWWGHQIPAWYDEDGVVYVARTEAEAQLQAPNKILRRDEDVLDTWYSSALVPFSTMGWPEKTADMALYLPSSVLVTGYDIIFFWVARMVMMTTHFTGQVPFKHVYMHGLVKDAQGKKMSKSEGNVLDPVDLIDGIDLAALLEKRTIGLRRPETAPQVRKQTEKEFPNGIPAFGADALRLTFASMASLGRNISFDSKRCEGYRNFCNKLWNATRFVLMNCEGYDCGLDIENAEKKHPVAEVNLAFSQADRWMDSTFQRVQADIAKGFQEYRLDNVSTTIYHLVWDEFCDWYLEIAKVQIQNGTPAEQRATRRTLIRSLETILRLAHPIIPFITEALWQKVAPVAGRGVVNSSVGIAVYPTFNPERIDENAEAYVLQLKNLVDSCRTLRSDMKVAPSTKLPLYVLPGNAFVDDNDNNPNSAMWKEITPVLQALAKISEVQIFQDETVWQNAAQTAPVATVSIATGVARLCLFMAVDTPVEIARITKELAKLQADIERINAKLDNVTFVAKAPALVLEQERKRLAHTTEAKEKLSIQLVSLQSQVA